MNKLSPCPFCGREFEIGWDEPSFIDHKKWCWLYPATAIYSNDKEAVSRWNRRAKKTAKGD